MSVCVCEDGKLQGESLHKSHTVKFRSTFFFLPSWREKVEYVDQFREGERRRRKPVKLP